MCVYIGVRRTKTAKWNTVLAPTVIIIWHRRRVVRAILAIIVTWRRSRVGAFFNHADEGELRDQVKYRWCEDARYMRGGWKINVTLCWVEVDFGSGGLVGTDEEVNKQTRERERKRVVWSRMQTYIMPLNHFR